jgi:hypothetical protein
MAPKLYAQESVLSKIIARSKKFKLHYIITSGKKSYLINGNSFKTIPNDFFYDQKDSYVPSSGIKKTNDKTLEKLIEVSRIKKYQIYLKKGQTIFELTNDNKIVKKNIVAMKKKYPHVKKKKKIVKKKRKKGPLATLRPFLPGFHYKKFNGAFKRISLGKSSILTTFIAYSPYYHFKFPLLVMGQFGGNIIQGTTKNVLAIDTAIYAIGHYPLFRTLTLGIIEGTFHLGLGQQRWTSVSQTSNIISIGFGLWFNPFIFVDEANFIYTTVKRPYGDAAKEIKLGIGASF